MRLRLFYLLLAIFTIMLPASSSAQSGIQVKVGQPVLDDFPTISFFMDARDATGQFIEGIDENSATIIEDEHEIKIEQLEALQPGAQFVVALNPSINFAIRDVQGKTRYDYIVQALETWADSSSSKNDDFSLIVTTGLQRTHLSNAQAWLKALNEAPTDYRSAVPNLQILPQAIGIASDPTPRKGMGHGVLFITPNPEQDAIPAFENATALANEAGVQINVWMVSSESFFGTQGALALQKMAQVTGGDFFTFSGGETLPDLERYLETLRRTYQVIYTSQITSEGTHSLSIKLTLSGEEATSAPRNFPLNVLPPNPIFVSPPIQILIPVQGSDKGSTSPDLIHTLEIIVEFTDGYPRPLKRTTLYVDGNVAVENIQPPFDQFNWDVSSFTESGRHIIQVEAVDTLGLSSISIETPIDITVQQPTTGLTAALSRNSSIIAAIAVLFAGGILILVLILAVRIRPNSTRPVKNGIEKDVVFQPVSEEETSGRLQMWASQLQTRLQWPPRSPQESTPFAYLERLLEPGDLESLTPTKPITIAAPEVLIGSDPNKVNLVLDDVSIDNIHARLVKKGDSRFQVYDENSVAGTWVNFNMAGSDGLPLEHGDLLHIGKICFRFKLHNPKQIYTPEIIHLEDER